MANRIVNELAGRLTRVDHKTVRELHRLRTGGAELAGYDDFAALRVRLHDEAEYTVARAADGKASEKFVAQRFALCDGGESTVLHFLSIQLE